MKAELLLSTEAWEKDAMRNGYRWSHVVRLNGERILFVHGNFDGVEAGSGPSSRPPDYGLMCDISDHIQAAGLYDAGGYAIYNGDLPGQKSGAFVTHYDPPLEFELTA